MAKVKTMKGVQLLVQIGNGANPEVFAHDCLINTDRGIAFSSDENTQNVPDCDDPELPAWVERNKDGLQAVINGSGMLHTASVETFFNWMNSDDAKNVRVLMNGVSGANGGGYFAGAFKLTSFEITATRNEKVTCSLTLGNDGPVTWTDNA